MSSINKKISTGILWNLASLLMTRGASTIFTLFLARLLVPDAFGLIAMATIVFELANTFVNSGLGTAIIRSKSITTVDLNTAFFTNIAFSAIAYIVLFLGAPYVADFYNQAELTLIIQIMGLTVFINAANIVQMAIFSRDMDFKAIMKSNTISVVLSGIFGIIAAWYGFGVWSLVIQTLSATSISAIALWYMSNWRPKFEFNYESFIQLFRFSKHLLAEGFIDVIFRNSYVLVIGRLFSAELTGLYSFANKISNLVSQQLTSAIQQATLPALSSIQDEQEALRIKYRQIIQITLFIIAPLMVLLAAVSPVLIPFAFKDSWTPAVPYLQLLCITGVLYPLHAINMNLLLVKGRSDLIFKVGLVKRAISIMILFLAIPYGVIGIIIGQALSSSINLIPNTYFTSQLINYSLFNQFRDIVKPIFSAFIAGICSWYILVFTNIYPLFLLILCGTVGLIIYFVVSLLIRSEGALFLIKTYRTKLQRKVK